MADIKVTMKQNLGQVRNGVEPIYFITEDGDMRPCAHYTTLGADTGYAHVMVTLSDWRKARTQRVMFHIENDLEIIFKFLGRLHWNYAEDARTGEKTFDLAELPSGVVYQCDEWNDLQNAELI